MKIPTVQQLEGAVAIRKQIDHLEHQLTGLFADNRISTSPAPKRKMSAAARAKISAATRRWARVRRNAH